MHELVLSQNIKFLSKESQALNARKQTMKRLVESLQSEVKSWSEIDNVNQVRGEEIQLHALPYSYGHIAGGHSD